MNVKSLLSLALILLATTAFAQQSNLRRAKTSYNKFNDLKMVGNPYLGMADLKASLASLEKAVEHDKTKDVAETWVYYALATADMALLDTTETSANFFKTAVDARQKALQLDQQGEMAENLNAVSSILAQYELNQGVTAWDAQDFQQAYKYFDRASEFMPGDTTLLYYAGIAAINSENYDNAIAKYVELVPIDSFSQNRQIILDVSRLYLMREDTVSAIKYAKIGTDKYPEDSELATHNIEVNLMAGKDVEVIADINNQIKRDPNNKNLHYYLGIAYSASGDAENAEKAYRQALVVDPNYVEANINLGGLILNRGIDVFNAANNDRSLNQQQYDAALKNAHDIFDQALPFLQKAVDTDGTNLIALDNLMKYYQIKENQEKADEIKARMDAIR